MTTTIKLIGALAALSVSGSLFAQVTPANSAGPDLSAGLLGHRYATAGFEYVDVNHSNFDTWATGALINEPVAPNVDVGLDYAYSWVKGAGFVHSNDLETYANYYFDSGALKPYGGLSLGCDWFDGRRTATWSATAGLEYQINAQVVVTGALEYNDDFRRNDNSGQFDGKVTGHYWFTKQIAAFASVSWLEYGDFGYGGGVAYKF